MTIELLLLHFYNIGYTSKNKDGIILYSLIPISLVLIFNIFYLFRRRNKIKKKYEDESKIKKIIGNIVLFVYGALTIIIFFIVGDAFPKV